MTQLSQHRPQVPTSSPDRCRRRLQMSANIGARHFLNSAYDEHQAVQALRCPALRRFSQGADQQGRGFPNAGAIRSFRHFQASSRCALRAQSNGPYQLGLASLPFQDRLRQAQGIRTRTVPFRGRTEKAGAHRHATALSRRGVHPKERDLDGRCRTLRPCQQAAQGELPGGGDERSPTA